MSESQSGGFLDPLMGTVIVAVMAMAIAVPLGVAIGVWLSEFGRPSGLARVTESTIEMLAGSPSIVLALFGTLIFDSAGAGVPVPERRRRLRPLVLRRRRDAVADRRCR